MVIPVSYHILIETHREKPANRTITEFVSIKSQHEHIYTSRIQLTLQS